MPQMITLHMLNVYVTPAKLDCFSINIPDMRTKCSEAKGTLCHCVCLDRKIRERPQSEIKSHENQSDTKNKQKTFLMPKTSLQNLHLTDKKQLGDLFFILVRDKALTHSQSE